MTQHSRLQMCKCQWSSLQNIDYQTLICVLVARPRRCLTLSNPVPWQNWMAAYLGYTLRMRMLFRGWPIMVNDTHTRRRRLQNGAETRQQEGQQDSHTDIQFNANFPGQKKLASCLLDNLFNLVPNLCILLVQAKTSPRDSYNTLQICC